MWTTEFTVYVGTGGTVFEECVELSRFALDMGADGVMVISPYYFNLPDSSIPEFLRYPGRAAGWTGASV